MDIKELLILRKQDLKERLAKGKGEPLSDARVSWIHRLHEIDLILDAMDGKDALVRLMRQSKGDKHE